MVELVDSVDLGSTAIACRFESCCPHHRSCCLRAAASFVFRAFLPSLAVSRSPLRSVGRSEADADAVFIDFKPQTALPVILGEPGKWADFRTEKVRTTYASSALSLLATNGNLAAAMDFLQQQVIDLLLQSLDFIVQIRNMGIGRQAFHFP